MGLAQVSSFQRRALTNVPVSITSPPSRSRRGLSRGYFRKWNGSGSCARRYDPRPGGLGIALAGTMTGLRGAPLDWDSTWRLTAAGGTSQETRPGLSHGINLRGKCRGGAPKGERARSADGWQRPHPRGARRIRRCGLSVRAFRRFASLHFFGERAWEGLSYRGVDKLGCEGASREGENVTSPLPARGER